MDDAVRYYADKIRAESLRQSAQAALDAGNIGEYRRLSAEAAELDAAADAFRRDIIRRARELGAS